MIPRDDRPGRTSADEAPREAPAVPDGPRYPAPRTLSRGARVRLLVVAGIVVLAGLAWYSFGSSSTTVRGKEFGFSVQGPEGVEITFDVAKPPEATVVCNLDALNENYAQVGTKDVTIGPTDGAETRYTTRIATTELAVTAVVGGCRLVD